ncbi:hypothetical protein ACSQ67_000698 [Phaseolus vulgaris]
MQEKMEVAVKTQETFSQNQDSNRGITKFGKNGGKHGEEDGYWMQGGLGDLKITSSEIKVCTIHITIYEYCSHVLLAGQLKGGHDSLTPKPQQDLFHAQQQDNSQALIS